MQRLVQIVVFNWPNHLPQPVIQMRPAKVLDLAVQLHHRAVRLESLRMMKSSDEARRREIAAAPTLLVLP